MKKRWTLLCLVAGLLFATLTPARGAGVMASDISWKCKGKDTYEVTITIYRDCNDTSLVFNASDFKVIACGSTGGTVSLSNLKMSKGADMTPTCKAVCTRCVSGKPNTAYGNPSCSFAYGVEEFKFTGMLYLSKLKATCCDIRVSWEQNGRSSAITTGPSANAFYTSATINRCASTCDNSPYFSTPPVVMVCKGQCITLMGAKDDDVDAKGNPDSLSYYPVKPMDNSSAPVNWSSPYTWDKPMRYDGFPKKPTDPSLVWSPPICYGYRVDSFTGVITFKSTKVENTILSIKVDSWGKDASGKPYKKGETRRDMQLIIVDCKNNKIPTLSNADTATINRELYFCAGVERCFSIASYDPDLNDTVSMDWNKSIPGATFTVEKGKKYPRGQFCWKPAMNDVRSSPYVFVVNAVDDACPAKGATAKSFRVRVVAPPAQPRAADTAICGLSALTLKATGAARYRWYASATDTQALDTNAAYAPALTKSDTFYVAAHDSVCESRRDTVVVTVLPKPAPPVITGDKSLCRGQSGTYTTPKNTGSAHTWIVGGGVITSGAGSDSVTVRWTTPGSGWVMAKETNAQGCSDSSLFYVTIHPDPSASWTQRHLSGRSYLFTALDTLQDGYAWSFGDGGSDTGYAATHTYAKDSTYTVSLEVKSAAGCRSTASDTLMVRLTALAGENAPGFGLRLLPNPMHESATLLYALPQGAQTLIQLLDLRGRPVVTLAQGWQGPGSHACPLDAARLRLAPGTYLLRLQAGEASAALRVVVK